MSKCKYLPHTHIKVLVLVEFLPTLLTCLFVTEATHLSVKTGSEQGSYANPLCQVTALTAESFAAPVLDVFLTPLHGLKSQHVMRDTALEFGLPSGTGKLMPQLLDAGTSSCPKLLTQM